MSAPFPVLTGVKQGCVLVPVFFALMCLTQLLHKGIGDNIGVSVDYRLDGNLFNIRTLQETTTLHRVKVLELQCADDGSLVSHILQDLQSVLYAAVRAYSRLGITISTHTTCLYWYW